jgi:hypothetical protein
VEGVQVEFFGRLHFHWFNMQREFLRFFFERLVSDILINGIWNLKIGCFKRQPKKLGIKGYSFSSWNARTYILKRIHLNKAFISLST